MRSSLVALSLAAAPTAKDPGLQQTSMVVWKWPEPYFEAWSAIEVLRRWRWILRDVLLPPQSLCQNRRPEFLFSAKQKTAAI